MKKTSNLEKKLGRGLSALIGESRIGKELKPNNFGEKITNVENIALEKITAGIYQPRKSFSNIELQELAESIQENGLIQPIILRKVEEDDQYEIIAGERRYRAAKLLNSKTIPAIIKKINNHEALELAIVENTQRSDLSPIEEARAYQRLIEEFSYTQEKLSKKVGKSRSYIANILRLLSLPKSVQEMLDQNIISAGHARAIINSNNPEELSKLIINQKLSVRDIENIVKNEKEPKFNSRLNHTIDHTKLSIFENDLFDLTKMETKISYNFASNSGKITLKFSDIEEIQNLIRKLN